MKAYKFRAIEQFEFTADILIHRRLYCSESRRLNDVREGDIRVGRDDYHEFGDQRLSFDLAISHALATSRVCCLSETFDNHLLWAYYAGGYTGVAIEVDIPETDLIRVSYSDDFVYLSDYFREGDSDGAIRAALSKKFSVWSHERELRLISSDEYYPLRSPISRVIVGPRIRPAMAGVLELVCDRYHIPIDRAIVSDSGIYTCGMQSIVGHHIPS